MLTETSDRLELVDGILEDLIQSVTWASGQSAPDSSSDMAVQHCSALHAVVVFGATLLKTLIVAFVILATTV